MTRNIANAERAIRTVCGLGLVAVTLVGIAESWAWLGAVAFVSAAVGWCPVRAGWAWIRRRRSDDLHPARR